MGRRFKKPFSVKAKADKPALLKLDLGCGANRRDGYTGVDIASLPSVDVVHDLFTFPWPFKDESAETIHCSHFLEHVPGKLRGRFMDEVWRILVPEGTMSVIVPYARSMRSVQDFTHEWPPICEESFLYFNKAWREANGLGHYPVTCDFDFTYGYGMNQAWVGKHEEARNYGLAHYWNVVADLHVSLTKRPAPAPEPPKLEVVRKKK